MKLNRTFVAVAASAALVLSAAPAHAQRRGGDHGSNRSGGSRQSQAQAQPRAQARQSSRGNEGQRSTSAARSEGGNRSYAAPRAEMARPYSRGSYEARGGSSRGYSSRGNSYRGYSNGYANRGYSSGYRGRDSRGYGYRGGYAYRGYGPHYSFFSYYAFRPRISLGFGIWAGYPIAYPDYYGYYTPDVYVTPAPYPSDSYAYGSQPSYGYGNQPPPSSYDYQAEPPDQQGYDSSEEAAPGGVSFEITPASAAIFVDGTYVGTASMFAPTGQPLGLVPGRHHIEVRAEGYRTMTFDADVTAGQVVPYRGTLQR